MPGSENRDAAVQTTWVSDSFEARRESLQLGGGGCAGRLKRQNGEAGEGMLGMWCAVVGSLLESLFTD